MSRRKITTTMLCIGIGAAILVAPTAASALNPVTFSPVGNMTTKRDAPGAAPLPDGRILIAGGYDGTNSLNSAEIFNPSTNTFSASGVGTMNSIRYGPAVAALPDGRVLVAGGYNNTTDVTSAEVFNPSTGTFSPVGSMATRRELAAAAPLPDGRILVAGGVNSSANLSSTEIFDPNTNTFSAGPPLPAAAFGLGGAVVSGGRVLVAGGYDNSGPGIYFSSANVFNPPSATFSSVGSLSIFRYAPAAASLPGGRALIAGGYDSNNYVTSAEIFDPTTNSFSSAGVGSLAGKREEAAGAALPDGRALVAGGYDGSALQSAEVLSVPSNAFTAKVKGRKVIFTVTNEGTGSVSDVSSKAASSAKKKKKKKKPKLVKTTSVHGGPGTIVVKVKLTKSGSALLAQKGKLKVRVSYTPDGGLAATKKLKLRTGK